ncbi:MAG: hypothetical protein U0263_39695 [Polyangiaceae bacterium]
MEEAAHVSSVYDSQHRDALAQAYPLIPATTRADTIVMVTVTNGNDAFMY